MKKQLSILAAALFAVTLSSTTTQAQDLTQEYLDAIDQARATAETAKNARERQKAEQNVTEFELALEELANPQALPGSVRVVSVECNGECSDNTLGQVCSRAGAGFTPVAVDCANVDDDGAGIRCGGASDNRCSVLTVSPTNSLALYCDDTSGWDANVYCAKP